MLRHLLRTGQSTRLLIVGTYRSTDLTRAHPLAAVLADLHRDATAERITLGGLGAEDVGAFLRAAGHDDERLGETLATVTSGNPFFLIEVLRHLEETGRAWDAATLPQGVREAVDRRLSHLSELANEALLAGAVAGSQFSLHVIEHVLGADLVEAIAEARRAGLVVEETGDRFRFYHALVRQSLLAECVSVKRVRLHQRIAAALEADSETIGDDQVADLARHYFECAFAGGAAKAVDYSRRAGEQAMVGLAYEKAADLFAQALHAA
jgi:predicted ATPase